MATIKVGQLRQIKQCIEEIKNYKLKAVQWYWIGRISQFLDNEIAAFEEAYANLFKKYGEIIDVESYLFTRENLFKFLSLVNQDNQNIDELINQFSRKYTSEALSILPNRVKDFNEECKVLLDQEISIPFKPLKLSLLDGIEELTGTSSSLMVFFEEPDNF